MTTSTSSKMPMMQSIVQSLSDTWNDLPLASLTLQDDLSTKADRIEACLSSATVDLWELRELALSKGGLLSPHFRQRAWPLLVGLDAKALDERKKKKKASGKATNSFHRHDEEEEKKMETSSQQEASLDMIRRDVGRSVVFRYNASQKTPATPTYASDRLAQALEDTIMPCPHYHYYQGLHDVAGVVLHQLDYQAHVGAGVLQQLAQSHWRDALRENFANSTWMLQFCLLPLVEQVDPHVHYQLQLLADMVHNLVLPWMITWFTHDVFDADTAGRLVDAFLVSHALMPLYFSVALVTHWQLRLQLLSADNDPASLFLTVKQLPKYIVSDTHNGEEDAQQTTTVTVQELLDDALAILHKFPPRALLELIDPQLASRSDVMERANGMSVFQATKSWNLQSLSSEIPMGQASPCVHVRSKVASGIPLLIQSVSSTWRAHYQRIQRIRKRHGQIPNNNNKKKKWTRVVWQKVQRLVFGGK